MAPCPRGSPAKTRRLANQSQRALGEIMAAPPGRKQGFFFLFFKCSLALAGINNLQGRRELSNPSLHSRLRWALWSSPLCRVGRPCLTGLNQIYVCRSAEGGTRSALLPRTMSSFCSCSARGDTCKSASFALCKQGIRKWFRESILKGPPARNTLDTGHYIVYRGALKEEKFTPVLFGSD